MARIFDSSWTAETLKESLCRQLRSEHYFAVCEASLGRGRVDVLALLKTFRTFRPVCYEIKVSRGDFLQDVKADKWRKYQPYGLVAFAVPEGLVDKQEIPGGAGLRVRYASGWRWVKRGKLEPPADHIRQELLTRLLLCVGDQYHRRGQNERGWRDFSQYKAAAEARQSYAREVMQAVNRRQHLVDEIASLERRRLEAMESAHEEENRARELRHRNHPHRLLIAEGAR